MYYAGTEVRELAGKAKSESMLAEEALSQNEDPFRSLAEMSSAAIILYNCEGIVYANRAAEIITGYSRDELFKKKFWELFRPGHQDMMRERGLAIQRDGLDPACYEAQILNKSGILLWTNVTAGRIELNGEPAGVITLFDITWRMDIAEALRESEERLRLCISTARLGSYDWDIVNDRHIWSPETYDIYGIPQGTPLTMDYIHGLVFPEDLQDELFASETDPATSHGGYWMEYRIRRPSDGTIRWINTNTRVFFNGEGAGRKAVRVIGVIRDVTEHRQAEEKLRLTQFTVDNFTDSSIWLDPTGRVIYVNDATCLNLGYTRDELLSMMIRDIDPYFDHLKCMENWNEIKKIGANQFESIHVRKDGSSYPVEVSEKYLKFADREYIVAFDRDITERKLREKELSNTKARAELYLDLMGHDINNMHQVALGYLELARDLPSGGEQAMFIDKSMEVLQRSTLLIKNVRMLQNLHDGKFPTGNVDVCRVLADVQSEYGAVAGKKILLDLCGNDRCIVRANDLLHDVFANLVNNAVKHTGHGKAIIVDLDVTETDGKRYCRVAVEDDGPGIPDDLKDKVFNRMHLGTAKGMGLGLYLARSLVESYGGRVWVEDRVKGDHARGARFVVVLPVLEK